MSNNAETHRFARIEDKKSADVSLREKPVESYKEDFKTNAQKRVSRPRLSKADIGAPSNFVHVAGMKATQNGFQMVDQTKNVDTQIVKFLKLAGLDETVLENPDKRKEIQEFVDRNTDIYDLVEKVSSDNSNMYDCSTDSDEDSVLDLEPVTMQRTQSCRAAPSIPKKPPTHRRSVQPAPKIPKFERYNKPLLPPPIEEHCTQRRSPVPMLWAQQHDSPKPIRKSPVPIPTRKEMKPVDKAPLLPPSRNKSPLPKPQQIEDSIGKSPVPKRAQKSGSFSNGFPSTSSPKEFRVPPPAPRMNSSSNFVEGKPKPLPQISQRNKGSEIDKIKSPISKLDLPEAPETSSPSKINPPNLLQKPNVSRKPPPIPGLENNSKPPDVPRARREVPLPANPLPSPPPTPPEDPEECLKGMAILPPLCPPCPPPAPAPCAPSIPKPITQPAQQNSVINTQKKKVFGKDNLLEEIRQKGGTMGAGLRKLKETGCEQKQEVASKNDGSLTSILQNALDVIHSASNFSDQSDNDNDDGCDSW